MSWTRSTARNAVAADRRNVRSAATVRCPSEHRTRFRSANASSPSSGRGRAPGGSATRGPPPRPRPAPRPARGSTLCQDDQVAGPQGRQRARLDVVPEVPAGHRAVEDERGAQAVARGSEGQGLGAPMRHEADDGLPAWGVAAAANYVGGSSLVYKDDPAGVRGGAPRQPRPRPSRDGRDQRLESPFFEGEAEAQSCRSEGGQGRDHGRLMPQIGKGRARRGGEEDTEPEEVGAEFGGTSLARRPVAISPVLGLRHSSRRIQAGVTANRPATSEVGSMPSRDTATQTRRSIGSARMGTIRAGKRLPP